jgi:hypothetical protein
MTMRNITILAVVALLALPATGCGLANRGGSSSPPPQQTTAQRPPAVPAAAPAAPGASSADAAIERFAVAFTNWKFQTLAQTRRALAAQAVGPLRAEMAKEAQQAANDAAVRASTASNVGDLQGVIDHPGQPSIVVVHETAQLDDGRTQQSGYQVYLARAVKQGATYKVAFWKPVSS